MRHLLLFVLLSVAACAKAPPQDTAIPAVAAAAVTAGDPVEGARVARRVGCDGCHAEGGKGGGMDIRTPQDDRIVAPNLTERRAHYDDRALALLLRQGKTHDGHVPVGMPIKMLQHLSDREVRDITAWLRAIPAVDHPGLAETTLTPDAAKQFAAGTHPYSIDMLPDAGLVPPAAAPTEPLALGKHLAHTSCSECHGWDLNGFGGDDAPSLVVAKAYTPEAFRRLMRTGEVAAGGKSKTGFMSEVAAYRFSVMTDAEVAALKAYLDAR
jgi:cytochrome c553